MEQMKRMVQDKLKAEAEKESVYAKQSPNRAERRAAAQAEKREARKVSR